MAVISNNQFLQRLENYRDHELGKRQCIVDGASETKLQVYREVFDRIINHFKTFRPMLASIKHEYDAMIKIKDQQIAELQPWKVKVDILENEFNQKWHSLQVAKHEDTERQVTEKITLHKTIEQLTEENMSLQLQVEKLKAEVSAQYLAARDERDGRRLLLIENSALKDTIEDLKVMEKIKIEELEVARGSDQDDPIILQIALRQAREDLSKMQQKLTKFTADYFDVVPACDVKALTQEFKRLTDAHAKMSDEHEKIVKQHETLNVNYKQLLLQNRELRRICADMKRSGTPRPKWEKVGEVIHGGPDRWQQLNQGKSSDELVDILLKEITEDYRRKDEDEIRKLLSSMMERERDDSLPHSDIPKLLGFDPRRSRNVSLVQSNIVQTIKDIWAQKVQFDKQRSDNSRQDMNQYLFNYFTACVTTTGCSPVKSLYDFYDVCEKLKGANEHISFFVDVINHQADEEIYHHWRETLKDLESEIQAVVAKKEGHLEVLSRSQLVNVLKAYFPSKSPERIEQLADAAVLEAGPSSKITYRMLFLEDENLDVGKFLEILKLQYKEEKAEILQKIEKQLTRIVGHNHPNVLRHDVVRAVRIVDPEIDAIAQAYYLSRAFRSSTEDPETAVSIKTVIERLSIGNICYHTPRATSVDDEQLPHD